MLNWHIKQSIFYFFICFLSSNVCELLNRNDQQHDIDMLRRLLSLRNASSVLSDCTINMIIDGVYRVPQENTLAAKIIRLVEQTFERDLGHFKQTGEKLRKKLNQNFSPANLDKLRHDFNLDLKILLASQEHLQEIDIRSIPSDNGGSDVLRYTRKNPSISSVVDYDLITDEIVQKDAILQTFSISHVRETLNNDPQKTLTTNGWWLGPVLCEKNPLEEFLMAYIYPLTTR